MRETNQGPAAETLRLNLELYRKLYLIRKTEEIIREHYPANDMKTPLHMSIGEEAVVTGVCQALGREDQVLGSYRSHALYLAKTGETDRFFAELYGKEPGVAKGKAGSMHLSSPESGLMGTSAIVASIIPVAVGAAFANKQKRNDKIVAVFFGDGAIDEGNFWESLNLACVMKLPVLFVCEDNGLSVHTPTSVRHGYNSIADVVSKFNCHNLNEDTTDVEVIYELARQAVSLIKADGVPCFMHLRYYRYLEHVGINEDFDAGYRSRAEFVKWYERDPVNLQRKKLLQYNVKEGELAKIESEINNQIENSVKLAQKAPLTKASAIYEDVLCD